MVKNYKATNFSINQSPENKSTSYEHMSDAHLWMLFKVGDRNIFQWIYEHYVKKLYNYGRHICKEEDIVKDSIQELFIELWEKRERLGETTSIKFYLYTALRRKLFLIQRKQKFFNKNFEIELYDFEVSIPQEAVMIIDQNEIDKKRSLYNAIKTLSKSQKEAIYLKFFAHLNYQEISDIKNISLNASYNLISKSLIKLKQHIDCYSLLFFLLFQKFFS